MSPLTKMCMNIKNIVPHYNLGLRRVVGCPLFAWLHVREWKVKAGRKEQGSRVVRALAPQTSAPFARQSESAQRRPWDRAAFLIT